MTLEIEKYTEGSVTNDNFLERRWSLRVTFYISTDTVIYNNLHMNFSERSKQ